MQARRAGRPSLATRRGLLATLASAPAAGVLGLAQGACIAATAPPERRRLTLVLAVPEEGLTVTSSTGGGPAALPRRVPAEWTEVAAAANVALASEGLAIHVQGLPAHAQPGGGTSAAGADELAEALATGTPPDLVGLVPASGLATIAARQLVQPLDRLLGSSRALRAGAFPEGLLGGLRRRGQLFALPVNVAPTVLWYDSARFAAAGQDFPAAAWSWATFGQAAAALTARDASDTVEQWGLFAPDMPYEIFIWQAGGELFTPDLLRSRLHEPPVLEALQFVAELYYTYRAVPLALPYREARVTPEGIRIEGAGRAWRAAMTYQPFLGGRHAVAGHTHPAELPRGRARATRVKVWLSLAITAGARDAPAALKAAAACLRAFEARGTLSGRVDQPAAADLAAAGWAAAEAAVALNSFRYGRTVPLGLETVVAVMSGRLDHALHDRSLSLEQVIDQAAATVDQLLAHG